ncbi:XRE family transcriptional regulator [Streptomyces sp. KR80]|uniref:XRE family transcriptional regulator n=1 Tax=Streptomyces sp. KR80 TaxID=3457426 RepID=UPI003FD2B9C4
MATAAPEGDSQPHPATATDTNTPVSTTATTLSRRTATSGHPAIAATSGGARTASARSQSAARTAATASGSADQNTTSFPPSQTSAEPTFAAVFREALQRRGLSLERVRDRLEARGITISLATLSYWQCGRSQPERALSLRAVDALETILVLPEGTLRSLVGPHRPRGRAVSGPQDLTASQRVFGENSVVERALGEEFAHFNEDVSSLAIHETVRLDEHRCIREMAVNQVLRATRDGASRMTVVHSIDDNATESIDVSVRCGKLGTVRFLPELRSIVADILFGRKLAKNETMVVDYAITLGPSREISTHHERRTRVSLREFLLHVYFHPAALPVSCHPYYLERIGAERRYRHRIPLDVSHTAHMLPTKCPAGIHGMSWEWPG